MAQRFAPGFATAGLVCVLAACGSRSGLSSGFLASAGSASERGQGGRNGDGGSVLGGAPSAGGLAAGGTASGGSTLGGSTLGGSTLGGSAFGGFAQGGQPETMVGAGGVPEPPQCDGDAGLVEGPAGCVPVAAPRLLAPLSSSSVTSRRPTLRWLLADGTQAAHVQICRDRACAEVVEELDDVTSVRPDEDLDAGVYFWRVFGRVDGVLGRVASPTWQFVVPRRSAAIDTSWGTTLDANGDGYADVIIGAADAGTGGVQAGLGHAYFYSGSAAGLATDSVTTLTGLDGNRSLFGAAVGSAGDVNGDGFADVIVGAPWAGGASGRAYVYLGGAQGLSSLPATTLPGPGDKSAQFGSSVSSAGDLNGDGYADVVVGAPLHDFSKPFGVYVGQTYVYFGSAAGIPATPSLTLSGPESVGSEFGGIVASAGDVDGDGDGDLVIAGSPYIALGGSAYQASPAFYLYLGGAAGPSAAPSLTLSDQNWMSSSVASGTDLNGDGYADFAVGALGDNSADLYFGSASGVAASAGAHLLAQAGSGGYNYRLARAGDVNGDGYQDLVASYDQVFVYFGSANGLVDAPTTLVPETSPSPSIYGYDINQVGDINRDGYDDVVVGNKSENNFTGRAYVHLGGAAGLVNPPSAILLGPNGPGGGFG